MHGFRVSFLIATGAVAGGLALALFLPRGRPAAKPQLRASSEEDAVLQRVTEALAAFHGRIVGASGAPVARAKVTLIDRHGRQAGSAHTDESGRYAVRSPRAAPTSWPRPPRATRRWPPRPRTTGARAR